MPRSPDSGRLDLSEVFLRVQQEMLAQMAVGGLFEHASAAGAATEQHWINLFHRYLPLRYRATPAFVIDSTGRRSRQIDIAIFDNLYSPLLFPHSSGFHIPAESVYAVFEVKPTISRQWIRDAGEKAASVRALRRTSVPVIAGGTPRSAIPPSPILAGLLATSSVWSPETFEENVCSALDALSSRASDDQHLDLGCSLQHGAFEQILKPRPHVGPPNVGPPILAASRLSSRLSYSELRPPGSALSSRTAQGREARPSGSALSSRTATVRRRSTSTPDESLIFFILRLMERLRAMGTAPAADLMEYGRSLRSFQL
jgi:hypothetical protein